MLLGGVPGVAPAKMIVDVAIDQVGLNVHAGQVTYQAVADALGYKHLPLENAFS